MKRKNTTPRRIPLPKSEIDSQAILEEATKEDVYRAWLLVGTAILNLNLASTEEIPALADTVNQFIATSGNDRQNAADMRRAESMIATKKPYGVLDPKGIRSAAELESFKRKVYKLATYTALCVLFLGLERSGRFDEDQMKRIFLNVDLILAEIDRGMNTYKQLEATLGKAIVKISKESCT